MKSPCCGCTERTMHCHSNCTKTNPSYDEWREFIATARQKEQYKNEMAYYPRSRFHKPYNPRKPGGRYGS